MGDKHQDGLAWRKSTRSMTGDNNCVEIAFDSGFVLMRDSKDRDGATLRFTAGAWITFVSGIRDGEFDLEGP